MELQEYLVYLNLSLGMCLLISVIAEHFRFISQEVEWGEREPKGKEKKKVTKGELETMVREMFPEEPEENERSQARAGVIKLLKASARGMFAMISNKKCISILKAIATAGGGCPRCGEKKITVKHRGYRKYYVRRKCKSCAEAGRTETHYDLTGTVFEGTHLEAKQWLWGMYLFVGGSAPGK
ncbi:MAG: hypothetical protein GY792_21505 [Gammaproteobacteria bacterium]|nr:hypothetical protein [Gammaproteobacteria bacterium]